MAFLRALADATPVSVLLAIGTFVVSRGNAAPPLSPTVLSLLAGVAVLAGATGLSLSLQTEGRRYPLTRAALELLTLVE